MCQTDVCVDMVLMQLRVLHVHVQYMYVCACSTGLRHSPDEPPEGLPHTSQHRTLSDVRRRVRHRLLQETGVT